MAKIIVIDGGNYLHRAIFAFRNNYSIPATYTYCRMLIGDLKKVGFTSEDKVIIAQDYGKSWRKDIDLTYKAQRKGKREEIETKEWWEEIYKEFNNFFPKLEAALPWHFIKIYRIEADDIASVATRYYKDKDVILCSSDRDWEMLLTLPNVKIFSPISKKYKVVANPMKVLLEKIQGDISDNLLEKPSSEAEFEKRKKIVNLLELPPEIEQSIKERLENLLPRNLYLHKVPYNSVREELKKLYKEE
jgi:5'-3' exonuclease